MRALRPLRTLCTLHLHSVPRLLGWLLVLWAALPLLRPAAPGAAPHRRHGASLTACWPAPPRLPRRRRLHHAGFALRQNPFTAVGLDKGALLGAARGALGAARWRARCRLLRDQTEVLDEDEEPFEVGGWVGGRVGD